MTVLSGNDYSPAFLKVWKYILIISVVLGVAVIGVIGYYVIRQSAFDQVKLDRAAFRFITAYNDGDYNTLMQLSTGNRLELKELGEFSSAMKIKFSSTGMIDLVSSSKIEYDEDDGGDVFKCVYYCKGEKMDARVKVVIRRSGEPLELVEIRY